MITANRHPQLHPNPVSVTQFMWYAPEHRFIADMSEIRGFGRVWADSCDEGITLISRHAQRGEIVFVVDHTDVLDGDIRYWDLVPADGKPCGFTVRVYND
jgi:hypothetical protein